MNKKGEITNHCIGRSSSAAELCVRLALARQSNELRIPSACCPAHKRWSNKRMQWTA